MFTAIEKRVIKHILSGQAQRVRKYATVAVVLSILGSVVAQTYFSYKVEELFNSLRARPISITKLKFETEKESKLQRLLNEAREDSHEYMTDITILSIKRDFNVWIIINLLLMFNIWATLPLESVIKKLSKDRQEQELTL